MSEDRQSHAVEGEPPPRTSGLAIASLVLGILGLVTCVTAVPGLILGTIALVQTGDRPRALRGQGMALAGVILSGIAILMMPIALAVLFPVFLKTRGDVQRQHCLNNVKQLSSAMMMYSQDWDLGYPFAANWNESLYPYVKNPRVFICPAVRGTVPTYALNGSLIGKKQRDVVMLADTVMIFESDPGKDLVGGPALFPTPPRHIGARVVGFADGHVRPVYEPMVGELNFNPAVTLHR